MLGNLDNRLSGGDQFTNINFNFNFGGAGSIKNAGDILSELMAIFNPGADASNDIFGGNYFNGNTSGANDPAPVESPSIVEGDQPQGTLQTDGNKITTAGGYTIEPMSQFEWKITGPDGKSTRIWGDPHVEEGDGGKFDFKRNSTFVLGDGTRINVTTVPYGNGATVTGKLEVISGNDRIEVTDIDKGKGKIGTVTQDGYAHANSFQGDVLVQGKETDDWSFDGKEIIGSDKQGESFKLGGELHPGTPKDNRIDNTRGFDQMFDRFMNSRNWMMKALTNIFSNAFMPQNKIGSNPYTGNTRPSWEHSLRYDRKEHRANLTQAFRDMSRMFDVLSRMSQLSDRLDTMRFRANNYA
ncbi:MAG: DUF1521 domain-containing protein [Pyrinomonadaceae bacterium]